MKRLTFETIVILGLFAWEKKNIFMKRLTAYLILLLGLLACGKKDQPAAALPAPPLPAAASAAPSS